MHQKGDDPRWADPAFDDSAWPSLRMPEGAVNPGNGFSWYRFRVRLPEDMPSEPLALMVGGFGTSQAYEVFVNGERIGATGEPDGGPWTLLFPLPKAFEVPGHPRNAVVAIRLRTATFLPFLLDPVHRISLIGTRDAIGLSVKTWQGDRLMRALPQFLMSASLILFGVFFLLLSLWRRDAPEYLWFGLWLISATATRVLSSYPEALGNRGGFTTSWMNSLVTYGIVTGWVGLMSSLFGRRVTRIVLLAAAVFAAPYSALSILGTLGGSVGFILSRFISIFATVTLGFIYYELGWRAPRERERIPAIHMAILAYLATNILAFGGSIVWYGEAFNAPATLVRTVSLLVFTFAMAILMSQRNARLQGERQRLSREMESAAEVQQLLLSSSSGAGSVLEIDPVYLPAQVVGGDFYHLPDGPDGSRLVLVGDVSGKGLRAAMQVSATIGALRALRISSPAALLAALNDSLAGHTGGGFVTCCCARFDIDGTVTIANAGHPAPYCDGREVEVDGGLPLGIAPGVEYTESTTRGERFTFVSDGVVEAANAQGELFGFDRTCEISTKSAQEIAEAAKAWGQNDDITVVTVRRNG